MKKRFMILALAGMVMLAGCEKKENENSQSGEAIFTATIQQQGGSRTYIEPNAEGTQALIKWKSGDAIVVDNGQSAPTFTLISGDGATQGGFTTTATDFLLTDDYVAVYPATSTIDRAAQTLNVSIPGLQDGTLGNGANPMLAIDSDTDLPFRSLCGGLGVQLKGWNAKVTRVMVRSLSGEKLWGDFVVDYSAANPAITTTTTTNTNEQSLVVDCNLTLTTSQSKAVYFALPVGALNRGFELKVYGAQGEVIYSKQAINFSNAVVELNNVKVLSPITIAPEGAIDGGFSVSSTKKVFFSKGNLQYNPMYTPEYYWHRTALGNSGGLWRFAEHQYDYIGANPGNSIPAADRMNPGNMGENIWYDLFAWGTSGYDNRANDPNAIHFIPTDIDEDENNTLPNPPYTPAYNSHGFGPSTNMIDPNLVGTSRYYDWGVFNAISNGSNTVVGFWHTLDILEWDYVFNGRTTAQAPSGLRFAKATVAGVHGVIILPDGWNAAYYTLNNCNVKSAPFASNVINATDWANQLEANGAVFLPAAGFRYAACVDCGDCGYYWSTTYHNNYYARNLAFKDGYLQINTPGDINYGARFQGGSVRLVCTIP